MGERGRTNEDATAEENARIADLVEEAVEASAVGFSPSRTIGHCALWGELVLGTFAAHEELLEIALRFGKLGKGVIEAIPAGAVGELAALGGERNTPEAEFELMRKCRSKVVAL